MVGAGTDRTRPRLGGGPAVILVRPQLAVNIGMCARAMANFGLDDLRLVNPRQGWPRTDESSQKSPIPRRQGRPISWTPPGCSTSVEAAVGDLHVVYAATAPQAWSDEGGLEPQRRHGRDRCGDG